MSRTNIETLIILENHKNVKILKDDVLIISPDNYEHVRGLKLKRVYVSKSHQKSYDFKNIVLSSLIYFNGEIITEEVGKKTLIRAARCCAANRKHFYYCFSNNETEQNELALKYFKSCSQSVKNQYILIVIEDKENLDWHDEHKNDKDYDKQCRDRIMLKKKALK